jgi:hypothetical protein
MAIETKVIKINKPAPQAIKDIITKKNDWIKAVQTGKIIYSKSK